MKHTYKLNELTCANCANKIECKLNEQKEITKAIVNFNKLTVTITTEEEKNIKPLVEKIVREIEPNIKVLELHEKIESNYQKDIICLIISILLGVLGIFVFKNTISKILIIISYILLLRKVTTKAIKLLSKKIIDENLLITISCIGAYLTNNIHEGLMVIILYNIGKILETIAVNNSRKSISDLMDIKPEYANLLKDNEIIKTDPNLVKVGDIIRVLQGEKIPLDGIIIKGTSKLNTASLTGESKLTKVNIEDKVLSGSINMGDVLEIKVINTYENSTVAKILSLVETATDRKAKTETFVSKAARIYTPTVLILAILSAIILPILSKITLSEAIYRSLVFLVISCPCAIAISVPLSYFSGIGASSKEGILIKGSDYLDAIGNIKEIIFDKTGTITTGEFTDYKLEILDKSYQENEIINYLVEGEKLSNHPIAKSIIKIFKNNYKKLNITDFKEIPGKGIEYTIDNQKIKIGSNQFCKVKENTNAIYLNIDNKIVAKLSLYDGIKKEVSKTIKLLDKLNIKTKIFTGDNEIYSQRIAKEVGIEEVYCNLLPEDKFNLLEEEIKKYNNQVAFIGDGINDAPSLARASIGISLGGVGSASAIEASDIVIMNDELDKIITAINISRYTTKIIKQNLIFSLGIKITVLILSFFGITSMWQAVFADTGLTLLTILNTTRILKKYK